MWDMKPPVMFIPGTIAPADYTFAQLLDVMGDEIHPILKDLEVYAGDAPPPDYSLEMEVEGIKRVADQMRLDSFHLVGHSVGGAAALGFAASYPERVHSLALIEPGSIARIDSTDEEAAETDRILALPPEERLKEYSRLLLGADTQMPDRELLRTPPDWMRKRPAGIETTSRALRAYKLDWEKFRTFHQPVYLVRGSLSHPRWERQARRLAGIFPNITVEVYEGRSHIDAPHRAEPERFARALRKMMRNA